MKTTRVDREAWESETARSYIVSLKFFISNGLSICQSSDIQLCSIDSWQIRHRIFHYVGRLLVDVGRKLNIHRLGLHPSAIIGSSYVLSFPVVMCVG